MVQERVALDQIENVSKKPVSCREGGSTATPTAVVPAKAGTHTA